MSSTRVYRQSARATATAATRTAILDATVALAHRLLTVEMTLDQIAVAAGVSVQTVLRHFGSKDALFSEVLRHAGEQVSDDRRVAAGDIDGAVAAVIAHYEVWGDLMVRLVAAELSDDRIRSMTDEGKRLHRTWAAESFGPQLRTAPDADALLDLLVVATDLQVWSLLRRDRGLTAPLVGQRMLTLVHAILATPHAGALASAADGGATTPAPAEEGNRS